MSECVRRGGDIGTQTVGSDRTLQNEPNKRMNKEEQTKEMVDRTGVTVGKRTHAPMRTNEEANAAWTISLMPITVALSLPPERRAYIELGT